MRRIGSSLCFAALAVLLVGAAPAQPPKASQPTPPATNALRGAQAANAPAPPLAASLASADASAIPADSDQCRAACAHTYYFCLAGEDAPSCPQNWTSCLADCSRPAIQPDVPSP